MSNLMVIVHNNQRVLTTQQLAEGYETDPQIIRNNFNRNKERYIADTHYFLLEGAEYQSFRATHQIDLPQNISSMYLWTERGALLHAKSLSTERAWDMYQVLMDTYFRAKEIQRAQSVEDLIIMQAQSMKQLKAQVYQLETTTKAIKDTIITQPDKWREDINKMINRISITIGNDQFRKIRLESYEKLESRAHVNLERRLDNLRARMLKQGVRKSSINSACKMDVIESDPKLREIYSKIIQEYYIKYVA